MMIPLGRFLSRCLELAEAKRHPVKVEAEAGVADVSLATVEFRTYDAPSQKFGELAVDLVRWLREPPAHWGTEPAPPPEVQADIAAGFLLAMPVLRIDGRGWTVTPWPAMVRSTEGAPDIAEPEAWRALVALARWDASRRAP